jgi:hypothetical protein
MRQENDLAPVLIFALALAAFQKTEIENWWPIIKAAGIKAG